MEFEMTVQRVVHDVVEAQTRLVAETEEDARAAVERMIAEGAFDATYFEYVREAAPPDAITIGSIRAVGSP